MDLPSLTARLIRRGSTSITRQIKPSLQQQKQFCATSRRQLLCVAAIGGGLLGAGLSWAGHCRKQYEQLEREEAAAREAEHDFKGPIG
mgnify:CR=1 FL=1